MQKRLGFDLSPNGNDMMSAAIGWTLFKFTLGPFFMEIKSFFNGFYDLTSREDALPFFVDIFAGD